MWLSKEQCSSLKMILGSKHVGAILNYLCKEFYVYSLVGELINSLNAELNPVCHLLALIGAHHILHVSRIVVKWLCEMHGATIKIKNIPNYLNFSRKWKSYFFSTKSVTWLFFYSNSPISDAAVEGAVFHTLQFKERRKHRLGHFVIFFKLIWCNRKELHVSAPVTRPTLHVPS